VFPSASQVHAQRVLCASRAAGRRVAAVALVSAALLIGAAAPALANSGVPYQDPSAAGFIGLCDRAGQPVTHGTINTKPFVWRAVSSVAAPAPYNGGGRTAALYAFQPQQSLPPGDWSGDQLTASSRYSNAADPMAAGTTGDLSLAEFIGEYRPVWDGLLELRMFLGAPDQQPYALSYPATDIQVTGNTWHVVDGGTLSCSSGRAESIESILLPKSTTKPESKNGHPKARASKSPAPAASATATKPSDSRAGSSADASPSTVALQSPAGSNGHPTIVVVILAAGFVLIVAGGFIVSRRRRGMPGGSR
jgi:hypothetical protein